MQVLTTVFSHILLTGIRWCVKGTLLTSLELYIPRNSLAPPRSQRLNMNFQNRLMLFYHQHMSLNPH
jgi:hypothetical protein